MIVERTSTPSGFLLVVSLAILISVGVAADLRCSPHATAKNGFSECSNGRNHKSICETKCGNGYRLRGPSRMMCWCKSSKCNWTGVKAVCEKVDCDSPNLYSGIMRFVDVWDEGFAGLIEIDDVIPPLESAFGWSIVVIFDKPLGKKVSLISWNLDLTTASYDGQTFTFVNPTHHSNLTALVDQTGRFSALVVVENIEGDNPKAAFVGMYYRRVRDATCLMAPKMHQMEPLYSQIVEDEESPVVAPETTAQSVTPLEQKITPRQPRTQTTKPVSITTTPTTAVSTTAAATITAATTEQEVTSAEMPDGNFCVSQKHGEYYTTDKGWEDGGKLYFSGNIAIDSQDELPDWTMVVVFEDRITKIETWACRVLHSSEDGLIWTFGPHPWSTTLRKGRTDIRFIAIQGYAVVDHPRAQVFLCSAMFTSGDAIIGGTGLDSSKLARESATTSVSPATTTKSKTLASSVTSSLKCSPSDPKGRPVIRAGQTKPDFKSNNDGTKYNYNEVIHKSILFYEAQRSGRLPENNRIPWRGDSGLKDGCDIGRDLTGGWYDAGDNVKFNFPMAFSLTTLSWGGILFRDAYEDAGELDNMINAIKWPTEYFIKAHISKYELVGQVGHGHTDHNYWGRPEQMKMDRPTYKITSEKPGTELAAEVAAALAAASIFLRPTHPKLAEEALAHSKELFEFADKFRGPYHMSIPDASLYYKSWSGYNDELVWSAAWMYKATNDSNYLTSAEKFYEKMGGKHTIASEFSWDDKIVGAQALLAELTGSSDYQKPFTQFLDNLQRVKTTPEGLYYISEWGTNRYAANAALMLLLGAKLQPPLPKRNEYLQRAKKQIGLLLGDAGRSFVVGFGVNPPKRAHHSASSCPPYPERCDWTTYHSPQKNHYILYGALVGGPNEKGVYNDNRAIYEETEVACDYNAGFQSAVAGLKYFAMEKKRSLETTTPKATTTPKVTTTTKPKTTGAAATKKPPCRPKRSRKCIRARQAKKRASQS